MKLALTHLRAINVNAFWTASAPSLSSAERLLRPRRMLCLVYEPPSRGQLQKITGLLTQALPASGFAIEDVRHTAFRSSVGVCVVARPT